MAFKYSSYNSFSILDKAKQIYRKMIYLILFFIVGLSTGFYFLLSGGLDKPYTYVSRFINDSPTDTEYKFSPVLKEEKSYEGKK